MVKCENVYRRFVDFNERMAGLYLRIASLFCEHTALSQFWYDMALKGTQHAELLRFCLHEGLFAKKLPGSDDIRHLERIFARLQRDILVPVLSLEQAFDIAVRIETSGLNDAYDSLTLPAHESFYLLRRKIQLHIPGSLQKLAAAARECGLHKGSANRRVS